MKKAVLTCLLGLEEAPELIPEELLKEEFPLLPVLFSDEAAAAVCLGV